MAKLYEFNIERLKRSIINEAVPIMQKASEDLYFEIQQNSPVDTGYYLSKHHNKGVIIENNQIIAEVENIGDYPERVEEGFRNSPVNWHLEKGEIYYSKGADTYQKSVKKVGETLISKLK